jgi:hypothetical protein
MAKQFSAHLEGEPAVAYCADSAPTTSGSGGGSGKRKRSDVSKGAAAVATTTTAAAASAASNDTDAIADTTGNRHCCWQQCCNCTSEDGKGHRC